jgi:hypothetical protein
MPRKRRSFAADIPYHIMNRASARPNLPLQKYVWPLFPILRDELLSAEIFETLSEARTLAT